MRTPSTAQLEADLVAWWETESADWDEAVLGAATASLPGGSALWNDMPEVDSKTVARASPIFERHLGLKLDVKLIKPGGYDTIVDAIADLIPKMVEAAAEQIDGDAGDE